MKRIFVLLLFFSILLMQLSTISGLCETGNEQLEYIETINAGITENGERIRPDKKVEIDTCDFVISESTGEIQQQDGKAVVNISENQKGTWKFEVKEAGFYNIVIDYYSDIAKADRIELALALNHKLPFSGCERLELTKAYRNSSDIETDNRGNDIRPDSEQIASWHTQPLMDPMGYESEPLLFEFSAGSNTLQFDVNLDTIKIKKIVLMQFAQPDDYSTYLNKYSDEKNSEGYYKEIEGERPSLKSSPMLFAISDKTSPLMQPISNYRIKLNAVGGATWNQLGQWIQYDFIVDEPGFYHISLKTKQNLARGMKSYRKIIIDGEVPFKELGCVGFRYQNRWQQYVLGEEEPYRIYLNKGPHTLRIENILGEYASFVEQAEEAVHELNRAYQRAVMYMGATPDYYRDYMVKKNLPGVIKIFETKAAELKIMIQNLVVLTGGRGDKSAIISRLQYQLEDLADDPETLPKRMSNLKSNISALSAWCIDLRNQPISIDYITIYSPGESLKKVEAGFLKNAMHELKNFYATFIVDYSLIGDAYDDQDTIKVWITTGRDQANIVKRLIDDNFTKNYSTGVNLQLVQSTMVIPAIAGGIAADVVMQISNAEPVNYGMRGAIHDISEFKDCNDIEKRFSVSALTPLRYNNGLYGLPETESFPMLFYRKDILKDLEIEIPQTWDDLIIAISELEKNNMFFGLQKGSASYGIFLNQSGGSFYKADSYLNDLNTEEAVSAFEKWTSLYVNYKIPLEFDFVTRFRVGEMPLAIVDYGNYNNLQVTAPEIKGEWDFAPVPGTDKPDGTLDRSVMSGGNAVMMLESSTNKEISWKFMKWWTSDVMQLRYGLEMEAILGASARYPSANLNAFNNLPWSKENLNTINQQRVFVDGMPSVPGGYFMYRHLDNAFRKTVYGLANPRETLMDYSRTINDEIRIKCNEFKVDVER